MFSSYHTTTLESMTLAEELLSEADEDATGAGTDNAPDTSNKDIANDAQDVAKDEEDASDNQVEEPEESETEEVVEEAPEDDVEGETPEEDGDDESTMDDTNDSDESNDEELSPEEEGKIRNMFSSFRTTLNSYSNLSLIIGKVLLCPLSSKESNVFRIIKNKVDTNLEFLKELLTDPGATVGKDYKSLLTLYRIYLSDLTEIDRSLTLFISSNATLRKALKLQLILIFI